MPHTLLLRLPPPGQEETEWLSIDETGAPTAAKQRGPLSLAAAVARSARVVALAEATQILLAEPELPPGSGVKLARAVPFALEEQLTEDIDQLSFALGRRHANGRTPVAVVSRSALHGWLAELGQAGIEPAAIYADISLVPENPGQTVMWLEKTRLAVRRPGSLPFVVELTSVSDALVVAGVIADPLLESAEPKALESAVLFATREDWALVQDDFKALADRFESLKVQLLSEGPLPWLAKDLAANDAINLLQGEFARTTDYGARLRPWRLPALMALGLLGAHVAADAVQIHRANHESAALDAQITQIFSQAMPSEPVTNARRQMETQLEHIRHSGPGPQYFLHALEVLSDAISRTPNASIDALSYHEQSMDMKVTAPSLAALSQISEQVGRQGLAAEIQSSTPVAGGVEAHLQIRSAGTKPHR